MGNSLRCCLACVLPCGALDLVRIVHLNGRVEEYGRPVSAGEILAANPNHVLSKPCSQGVAVRRILIVSPDSELERGEIYFLIPAASVPPERKKAGASCKSQRQDQSTNGDRSLVTKTSTVVVASREVKASRPGSDGRHDLSRKRSSAQRRRTSAGPRTAVWRPHLECIVEDS